MQISVNLTLDADDSLIPAEVLEQIKNPQGAMDHVVTLRKLGLSLALEAVLAEKALPMYGALQNAKISVE